MTSWGWPKRLKSYLLPAGMLAAGTAALLTGLLPWPAFQDLSARTVPVLTFVVAMSLVTEMIDDAGLFRDVTERLAALGRGRVFLLWLLVIGLAVVSTVFLSLDTPAVLVTPVVVLLAIHARIPPLPFALTTVWLANTASLLLPVSNLTNLLAQDRLNLSPAAFAGLVWAPALVGILVPIGLLWLAFRKDLAGRYAPQPARRARDKVLLHSASGVMVRRWPHCSGTNGSARSTSRSAGAGSRSPASPPSSSPCRSRLCRSGSPPGCTEGRFAADGVRRRCRFRRPRSRRLPQAPRSATVPQCCPRSP